MKTHANKLQISLVDLLKLGDRCVMYVERDANEFINYGIEAEKRQAMIALIRQLKDFPIDDYYMGLQKLATEAKRRARRTLIKTILDIKQRYRLVFGVKSPEYSLFHKINISNLKDNDLVIFAVKVFDLALSKLSALKARQVTHELLEQLNHQREAFKGTINECGQALILRQEMTKERNKLAKQLNDMIREYCQIGKLIWIDRDEALYSNYLIRTYSKEPDEIESDENE
jgi:hypothetical protein